MTTLRHIASGSLVEVDEGAAAQLLDDGGFTTELAEKQPKRRAPATPWDDNDDE